MKHQEIATDLGPYSADIGRRWHWEYLSALGNTVRTSINEISEANKPRTIDEDTFLDLKNISPEEAKEINFFSGNRIGTLTHFTSGSTFAICVRYALTTGRQEEIELDAYEFVPERGSAKRIKIDS